MSRIESYTRLWTDFGELWVNLLRNRGIFRPDTTIVEKQKRIGETSRPNS